MRNKKCFATLFFLLFVLICSTSIDSIAGKNESYDTLVIQIEGDILDIDNRHWDECRTRMDFPRLSSEKNTLSNEMFGFQWQGFLAMLAPGETTYYFPNAAESWTVDDTGTEWTYTLREGATFHDGRPIRARDVKYSFTSNYFAFGYDVYGMTNLSDTNDGALGYEEYFFNVTYPATDPNGDGRVFTMNGAWWPDQSYLFDAAGCWNLFMLIPEGSSGEWDDTAEELYDAIERFEANPISCGPYKFLEHKSQDYALLERWDNWWGWGETFVDNGGNEWTFPSKTQAFKYLKFQYIADSTVALVEFQTGGIDVITSHFDSLDDLEAIKQIEGYDAYAIDVLSGASLEPNVEGDEPTFFNGMGNYPVSQEWFRKAVSHAIDRENIVNNVYGGIASVRDEVYPDWILAKFPGIDTTDYQNFSSNIVEADQILDSYGYFPLGFADEPANRFGYGPYLNETDIDGVEQTRGRHFVIMTISDPYITVTRALAIQKDLREVGIYTDVELLEWGTYVDGICEAMLGRDYNATYYGNIPVTGPDPDWHGPYWDFTLGDFGYYYETPQQFLKHMGSYYWFWQYGYTPSVFKADYEREYAKIVGGNGYMSLLGISDDTYPYPEWAADDTQYVEACEEAGRLMSHMLSTIPLVWYQDTYAFDDNLKNFLASCSGLFHCAYAYWEGIYPTTTTSTTTVTTTTKDSIIPGFEISSIIISIITLYLVCTSKRHQK